MLSRSSLPYVYVHLGGVIAASGVVPPLWLLGGLLPTSLLCLAIIAILALSVLRRSRTIFVTDVVSSTSRY